MKKIKYKEFKYKCELYPAYYTFVFTDDVVGFVWTKYKHDTTGSGAVTVCPAGERAIHCILPYSCPSEWMFHEVSHVAMCILGEVGVKYGFDNQEPLAYLLGKVAKDACKAFHARQTVKWRVL